jgi:hypothetical protein
VTSGCLVSCSGIAFAPTSARRTTTTSSRVPLTRMVLRSRTDKGQPPIIKLPSRYRSDVDVATRERLRPDQPKPTCCP